MYYIFRFGHTSYRARSARHVKRMYLVNPKELLQNRIHQQQAQKWEKYKDRTRSAREIYYRARSAKSERRAS